MPSRIVSIRDFAYHSINDQVVDGGTTVSIIDSNNEVAYFIVGIDGASSTNATTIKDRDGVTITIKKSEEFHVPLRIDGGFVATASSAVYIRYFTVPIGSL